MADNEFQREKLSNLLKSLVEEPEKINEMTDDELVELKKYINPVGAIIKTKKNYASFSITNWRERYIKKFVTTSMIAYIYRLLDEYEPEFEIESIMKTWGDDIGCTKNEAADKVRQSVRRVISRFMNRNFRFDPNRHVRAASMMENKKESTLEKKAQFMTPKCAEELREKCRVDDGEVPQINTAEMASILFSMCKETMGAIEKVMKIIKYDTNPDEYSILLKNFLTVQDCATRFDAYSGAQRVDETKWALQVMPPADLYYHFDRFVAGHYCELREICEALYAEQPDIEFSILFYDSFKSPEEARDFRIKHEAEFKYDVFTVENGAITLLGPFRENQKRIDFYNKNTEVMKKMMEQLEMDQKLGQDIMKKQVSIKKKKKIRELGTDDSGLEQYAKVMNQAREMGVKEMMTLKEQQEYAATLAEAQKIKDDLEVPDDAIQTNVYYPAIDEKGENILKRAKMYSQAEAPLHMQEGSKYVNEYQPVREEGIGVEDVYKVETVVGRDGRAKTFTSRVEDKKND